MTNLKALLHASFYSKIPARLVLLGDADVVVLLSGHLDDVAVVVDVLRLLAEDELAPELGEHCRASERASERRGQTPQRKKKWARASDGTRAAAHRGRW